VPATDQHRRIGRVHDMPEAAAWRRPCPSGLGRRPGSPARIGWPVGRPLCRARIAHANQGGRLDERVQGYGPDAARDIQQALPQRKGQAAARLRFTQFEAVPVGRRTDAAGGWPHPFRHPSGSARATDHPAFHVDDNAARNVVANLFIQSPAGQVEAVGVGANADLAAPGIHVGHLHNPDRPPACGVNQRDFLAGREKARAIARHVIPYPNCDSPKRVRRVPVPGKRDLPHGAAGHRARR
jgi:hypothetical protein